MPISALFSYHQRSLLLQQIGTDMMTYRQACRVRDLETLSPKWVPPLNPCLMAQRTVGKEVDIVQEAQLMNGTERTRLREST